MPTESALRAIRAWYRLERATAAFRHDVQHRRGISGEQLALLRIVAESDEWPLAELRSRLTMHPATLGQSIDRLAQRGLVEVTLDQADRRRRTVRATGEGRGLLSSIPLVGPVRLRTQPADSERLERLADAFEDAVELFGLEEWTEAGR